jgi:hypothetical protein
MESAVRGARTESGITSTPPCHLELRWLEKSQLRLRMRSEFAPEPGCRERNFWKRRHGAKRPRSNASPYAEAKVQELGGPKSPQKRPVWRPTGNIRFQTGDPPPSHRTGLRPAPGTEISSAETGRQKPAHHLAETDSETRRKRESPDSRARTARLLAKL